jgi:predicted transcriptional regulator
MKEILPSIRKRFWRRLRRDDLRLSADLLSSSKQKVRISSEKYEFDSVDDLLSCKESMARSVSRSIFTRVGSSRSTSMPSVSRYTASRSTLSPSD